jgi:hypothetical protein
MTPNDRGRDAESPGHQAPQTELFAHGVAQAEDINALASLAHVVAGLHIVPAGELIGVLAPSRSSGETEAVAFFERVRTIAASVTLIPSRFGEAMTCDSMREALHVRRERLRARLVSLRGFTEMCLRFDRASLDEAIAAAHSRGREFGTTSALTSAGAAFLRARREEHDRREGITPQQRAWISTAISPIAKKCKDMCIRGSTVTGPAAHLLVAKTECERVADDAARVIDILGVRASVSGPWPMYNFIDDD